MKDILKKLQKDESGTMMVYLASMLPVFFLCLLIAIDGANALAVKSKVGYTQDASAIAYSSVSEEQLQAAGVSREDYAMKFSNLNLNSGSSAGKYKINLSENGNIITASSEAIGTNSTFFGAVAGKGDTQLGTGKATKVLKTTASNSTSQQVLLSLVLDGSGSMSQAMTVTDQNTGEKSRKAKYLVVQDAVRNLIDETLSENSDQDFWVSQTMYGDNAASEPHSNNYLTVYGWLQKINANYGSTHGYKGINDGKKRIDNMITSNAVFASYQKSIIFMTDGEMSNGGSGDRRLNDNCTIAKNSNYDVYAIAFGDKAEEDVVRNCASDGKYYKAENGDQLIDIFRAITTRIISSRIAE